MDILIGSRDASFRRQTAAALGDICDRTVTTEKSGSILVEALDRDFDLVIIDTHLEGLDGRETLTILRQMRPRARVLYLHRTDEDIEDLAHSGGGRVCAPVRTSESAALIQAVKELTSRGPQKDLVSHS